MLLPKFRTWALDHLGVGERPIAVDLFASPTMTAADRYITREMDAFTFNWAALHMPPRQFCGRTHHSTLCHGWSKSWRQNPARLHCALPSGNIGSGGWT